LVNPNSEADRSLQALGQSPIAKPMSLAEIMRRPALRLEALRAAVPYLTEPILQALDPLSIERFEVDLKYAAFVEREQREVARAEALADLPLPDTTESVPGLRNEARQQIDRHRPRTFGEAQRIAGVTAADISALLIHGRRTEHAPL
jgi:tRNA uridine 5-carboxymethylaminomethyl modification enzyme